MKLSVVFCLTALLLLVTVDSLTPFTKPRFFVGLFATKKPSTPFFLQNENDESPKTPHPPDTPPPKQQKYTPRPTISLTQLMNEETRESLEKVGDTLKKELVVCLVCVVTTGIFITWSVYISHLLISLLY